MYGRVNLIVWINTVGKQQFDQANIDICCTAVVPHYEISNSYLAQKFVDLGGWSFLSQIHEIIYRCSILAFLGKAKIGLFFIP